MARGVKTGGRDIPPGVSGNPGGRPKVAQSFKEWCREWMQGKGLVQLSAMAENSQDPNHYRAVELIAAYAYGKPTQAVELDGQVALRIVIDDASSD